MSAMARAESGQKPRARNYIWVSYMDGKNPRTWTNTHCLIGILAGNLIRIRGVGC